jgi:hypothetical protein
MAGNRNDWLPTSAWHFTIDNYQQFNPALLTEVIVEQQRDRVGEKWSNVLGWHSKSNLHECNLHRSSIATC